MDYKNYNLLSAIIEHVDLILNKGIPDQDIRIFEQIDDIIYILISKEYNSDSLYKELEEINYELTEKYDEKLTERIYVDFFDNLYESERGLKQEMDIGIVKKELDIKYIRKKLEEIEKYYKFLKNLDTYTDTIKRLHENYNTKEPDISSIIFNILDNKIEPTSYPSSDTIYTYKKINLHR